MPVNYQTPSPETIFAVAGVRLGCAKAHVRKPDRYDLTLVALDEGATAGGVFTQNRFCAAPVQVCREHLGKGSAIRGLIINTGCANAGTGAEGLARAKAMARAAAEALGCTEEQVLPFSTGVILEPLPIDRIIAGMPNCGGDLKAANWSLAAQAIMTTDTVPKVASRQIELNGQRVTVSGISKGAGMIQPNMATLLSFIATDAAIAPELIGPVTRALADESFNRITIDGDTSTNDSFVVMATGKAGTPVIRSASDAGYAALYEVLREVAQELAQAIVRDGEGATKFIAINVQGGRDAQECDRIARAIAHSPLVKTAFYASDPNLGRILAAIGYAGVADLDVNRLKVYLDDVVVAEAGGRAASYTEEAGQRVMKQSEITIRVELGRGEAAATVWTCDLSHDYVSINADYRS